MSSNSKEDTPEDERVNFQQVRKEWLVHVDEGIAHRLQDCEISTHYGRNRQNNRLIRDDVQIAKIVQNEEEILQQASLVSEAEMRKMQAEHDAEVARMVAEELEKAERRKCDDPQAAADEELARKMQARYERRAKEAEMRQQMDDGEIDQGDAEEAQAGQDEMLAMKLQDRYNRRYARWLERQREKERLRDNAESVPRRTADDAEAVAAGGKGGGHEKSEPDQLDDEDVRLARQLQAEEDRQLRGQQHTGGDAIESDARLAALLQERERQRAVKQLEKTRAGGANRTEGVRTSPRGAPSAIQSVDATQGHTTDLRRERPGGSEKVRQNPSLAEAEMTRKYSDKGVRAPPRKRATAATQSVEATQGHTTDRRTQGPAGSERVRGTRPQPSVVEGEFIREFSDKPSESPYETLFDPKTPEVDLRQRSGSDRRDLAQGQLHRADGEGRQESRDRPHPERGDVSSMDTVSTPFGRTFNIAAAIDPTVNHLYDSHQH